MSEKTHHIGFFNYCIGWTLGSGLAPFIGGYFIDTNVDIGFWLVVGLFLVGFCCAFFGIPNVISILKDQFPLPSTLQEKKKSIPSNKKVPQSILLVILLMQTIFVKLLLAYFPNYAAESTGLVWSGTLIGQVTVWFGIARVTYFIIGRFWRNKFRMIPLILIGLSLILLQFLWIRDPIVLSILFALSGLLIPTVYISVLELMLLSEKKAKGHKAGLFEGILGIGMSFTPLFAGILGDINIFFPFIVFSILIGGISLFIWIRTFRFR